MRKRLVLLLTVLFGAACGPGSSSEGEAELPTLAPTLAVNESPRMEVTPEPLLPPTWTPVPAAPAGDLSGVGAEGGQTAVPSATPFLHTVARGETLGIIAARYNVSVSELVRLNNIANPDRIEVGQQLIIPVVP